MEPHSNKLESVTEFRVLVTMDANTPGSVFGIELDNLDGRIAQVCDLKPGVIKAYNQSCAFDLRVIPGDFIMSVNGSSNVQEMLTRLRTDTSLDLLIRRPEPFAVFIRKNNSALGLVVKRAPTGISLLVVSVYGL